MKLTMKTLSTCLALMTGLSSYAQVTHELSIGLGGNMMMGDVGQVLSPSSELALQAGYRLQFHEHYAIKLSYGQGTMYANDANSSIDVREVRNMSVRTPYQHANGRLEVSFLPLTIPGWRFQHSPYLGLGLGIINFEPQGYYQGEWVNLRPLGTEGQGTSLSTDGLYANRAWTQPFTLGWRGQWDGWFVIYGEASWVRTSSDYLDDVSGDYIDAAQLEAINGEAAGYFADRSLNGATPGLPRGNDSNTDHWFDAHIGIGLLIEPFMERCYNFLH